MRARAELFCLTLSLRVVVVDLTNVNNNASDALLETQALVRAVQTYRLLAHASPRRAHARSHRVISIGVTAIIIVLL